MWIDARENVFDATILAAGVHGLDDDENAVFVLCVEEFLKVLELVLQLVEGLLALIFSAFGE